MKELVVISGKGGTGKTSIVASFAAMADEAVLADCDVDAADLHLVLEPQIIRREEFYGNKSGQMHRLRQMCGTVSIRCRLRRQARNFSSHTHGVFFHRPNFMRRLRGLCVVLSGGGD